MPVRERLNIPHLELNNQSTDSFSHLDHNALASPPYRTEASRSQTVLASTPLDSPAYYRSGMQQDAGNEKQAMWDEKPRGDPQMPVPKPSVQFKNANLPAPTYVRQDSEPYMSSKPSSMMSDDDWDNEEEYDWSDEADLEDEEANFQKRMGARTQRKGWGFKRIVTLLFSSLIGSMFLSGVIITPALILHFYWYVPSPTPHRRWVQDNVEAWTFWAAANLLISWCLAMIVNIIPVLIRFFISAAWGHVSEYVKTRLELYDSVRDTVKPLLYAGSAWASWTIVFGSIYKLYDDGKDSRASYTYRVNQAMTFLFFMSLVLCVQKMLSHAIAFTFHRTAFKDRMNDVAKSLAAIEHLRDYKPKSRHGKSPGSRTPLFGGLTTPFSEKDHFSFVSTALRDDPNPRRDYPDSDADDEDPDVTLGKKDKKNKKKDNGKGKRKSRQENSSFGASGSSSRPLTPSGLHHTYPPPPAGGRNSSDEEVTIGRAAKVLKDAVLHDARNIKGKDATDSGLVWNVNSRDEAKKLARAIYIKFRERKRPYLISSDFYPAFHSTEEAEVAFRVFDRDKNGDISRSEIKNLLVNVYKERRSLSRSMRDVGHALKTLDSILLFAAFIVLFFISLSTFGVEVGDSLTSVYTLGIALSFIFKGAAASAFDSIMFLFVTHPFDTGDMTFIENEVLFVKKMGLFATVFTRNDGTETYYFNSQLFNKFITNVRRSGNMFEVMNLQVAWRTPLEKLDELERCLNEWLSTEENRWYEPSTAVTFQHIVFQRYLELTIGIGHNGTWQDWGLRNARKTAFHAAVQHYCNLIGIIGFEAPMPIVYADPETLEYNPATPSGDQDPEFGQPSPAVVEEPYSQHVYDTKPTPKQRPTLGFTAPSTDHSHLRARKSKGRKAVLRGMGDG